MKSRWYWLAGITVSAALGAQALAMNNPIPPFSQIGSLDDGWEPLQFPKIEQHTLYELVQEDGQQVVRATTEGGASGLITRLNLDPDSTQKLAWQWKVSNVFEAGNAREKSGDDYPARIYVAFEFQPEAAGFYERAKRKTVEVLFETGHPWITFHGKEGLGDGNTDLGRIESNQSAVAFNYLKGLGIGGSGRRFGEGGGCHGALLGSRWFHFTFANAGAHFAWRTGNGNRSAHPESRRCSPEAGVTGS